MEAQESKGLLEFREGATMPDGRAVELRPQQVQMAAAVLKAMQSGRHLAVEAPTGVGKSLAYLIPAIRHYQAGGTGGHPIIISTHTKALQEQLISKDIPAALALTGATELRAAIGLGRGNYLCMRRMHNAAGGMADFLPDPEFMPEVERVRQWSLTCRDGIRPELPFGVDPRSWMSVNAEEGNCLNQHCPHYKPCFFQKGRRRVFSADIVVVNHSLFFADLSLKMADDALGVLPVAGAVIFDEAHTLEDVAAQHLGLRISGGAFILALQRLLHPKGERGLFARHGSQQSRDLTLRIHKQVREFFSWLEEKMQEGMQTLTYMGGLECPFLNDLGILAAECDRLSVEKEDDAQLKTEFSGAARRLRGLALELGTFTSRSDAGLVYWMERSAAGRIMLMAAPVEVGPILAQTLFRPGACVSVLCSATLTVEGRFSYLRKRLGLYEADELSVDSPFDFQRQMKVYAASTLPDPKSEGFQSAACVQIERFVRESGGGVFVLFTSYRMLQECARELQPSIAAMGLPLLQQGQDMSTTLLLERFRAHGHAVLFGTDSFWTGVDVPGDALRNVILVRLPFSVPDHPLAVARAKAIEAHGGNPFAEISLPEAVLKFRQGVGRLIRTATDEGIVVLLDSRATRTGWGRKFLNSLPPCPRFTI